MISVFTCGCNYSIIGIIAGYSGALGASQKPKILLLSGLSYFAGIVISMAVLGGITGYASQQINLTFGIYWKIAAALICIFFGLLTMDILPFRIPSISINPVKKGNSFISPLIFGLTTGGLTLACSACCNPVFPVVFALSFVKGSFIWGILMLTVYAVGYGITLVVILTGIGLGFWKTSKTFLKSGLVLKYTGGILMILIGFYLLISI